MSSCAQVGDFEKLEIGFVRLFAFFKKWSEFKGLHGSPQPLCSGPSETSTELALNPLAVPYDRVKIIYNSTCLC
jgi:hypothetical protein